MDFVSIFVFLQCTIRVIAVVVLIESLQECAKQSLHRCRLFFHPASGLELSVLGLVIIFIEVDLGSDLAPAVVKDFGNIIFEVGRFVVVIIVFEIGIHKSFRILQIIAKIFNPEHSIYYHFVKLLKFFMES